MDIENIKYLLGRRVGGNNSLEEDCLLLISELQDRLTAAESDVSTAVTNLRKSEARFSQRTSELGAEIIKLRAQLAEQTTPAESVINSVSRLVAWDGQLIDEVSFVIEITMKIVKERDEALTKVKQLESQKAEQVSGGGEPVAEITRAFCDSGYFFTVSWLTSKFKEGDKLYLQTSPNKADVPTWIDCKDRLPEDIDSDALGNILCKYKTTSGIQLCLIKCGDVMKGDELWLSLTPLKDE